MTRPGREDEAYEAGRLAGYEDGLAAGERTPEPDTLTEGRTLREAAQRFLDADDTFDRFSDGPTDRRDVASFHRERAREALVRALVASPAPDPGAGLERGPWLNYTTHQVACPVGPWQSKSKEVLCTCGYTLLVDAAIEAGAE